MLANKTHHIHPEKKSLQLTATTTDFGKFDSVFGMIWNDLANPKWA